MIGGSELISLGGVLMKPYRMDSPGVRPTESALVRKRDSVHVRTCTSGQSQRLPDVEYKLTIHADSWASNDRETQQWRTRSQSNLHRPLCRCLKASAQSWMNTMIDERESSRRRVTSPRRARRCTRQCSRFLWPIANNCAASSLSRGRSS